MNKRKPDDEFEQINLSYIASDDREVVVSCPESQNAIATQQPARRGIKGSTPVDDSRPSNEGQETKVSRPALGALSASATPKQEVTEPEEQHFTILYGDTGHSYESIMGDHLRGAKGVIIEDPYIRLLHQIQNFIRFCETCLNVGTINSITLITGYDDDTQLSEISEKLDDLKQSLLELNIILEVKLNPNIHDREIRLDNGWVIKIGRGLDFYQRPESWFSIGVYDLSLRKCLETKVDIFKSPL
nr:MIT C-terminal domain-containing protein [Hyphomonas sp. L-53-1-40]